MQSDRRRSTDVSRAKTSRQRAWGLPLVYASGVVCALVGFERGGRAAPLDLGQRTLAADDVSVTTISFPSGSITMQAYLAKPKDTGKHSAVLVLHDNHGLDDHAREVARRLAVAGFIA